MSKATPHFMLLFRGGVDPATLTPAQREALMKKWFGWIGKMKKNRQFVDGAPLADDAANVLSGKGGKKITKGTYGKGAEEIGGCITVKARDLKAATKIAQGCPIFANQGTVEVRQVHPMP